MQSYRPHAKQVDSVLIRNQLVFSGGDHRVLVSDRHTGDVVATVTRDSGDLTRMFFKDSELFVCSSNGSVRSYELTHTGRNMPLTNTMWDHTRAISDGLFCLPCEGTCEPHSIVNHVCYLYTSSEDRSTKIWNTAKYFMTRSIHSNA
jgi:WD40 repeat protein